MFSTAPWPEQMKCVLSQISILKLQSKTPSGSRRTIERQIVILIQIWKLLIGRPIIYLLNIRKESESYLMVKTFTTRKYTFVKVKTILLTVQLHIITVKKNSNSSLFLTETHTSFALLWVHKGQNV